MSIARRRRMGRGERMVRFGRKPLKITFPFHSLFRYWPPFSLQLPPRKDPLTVTLSEWTLIYSNCYILSFLSVRPRNRSSNRRTFSYLSSRSCGLEFHIGHLRTFRDSWKVFRSSSFDKRVIIFVLDGKSGTTINSTPKIFVITHFEDHRIVVYSKTDL